MDQTLCYSCFREMDAGVRFCPHCGFPSAQDWEKHPHALPYGTVLGGKYITGRILGQGGFGITYAAQDYKTKQLVAIKEFFPDTMASRGEANSIVPYTGQRGEDFHYGKSTFLEEARTLAQFNDNPGIVQVYSYFEEYGTAYFAMEYVDGISFQQYIDQHGGRISVDEAKNILYPVMDALSAVHAKGIIHRDIKPDNIYITNDGAVKVLDFGSARYSMGEKSRSLDVVLTHGFAPREQYSRHGRQGAYTDVYALAATFYYAITGRRPPDSIDRIDEDALAMPSSLGAQIPHAEEDALLKALSVEPQDRFASMDAFKNALINGAPASSSAVPQPVYAAAAAVPVSAPQSVPLSGTLNGSAQWTSPSAPASGSAPAAAQKKKWLIPACVGGAVAVVAVVLALVLPGRNRANTVETSPAPAVTEAPAALETPRPVEVIDPSGSGSGNGPLTIGSGNSLNAGAAGYYPLTRITAEGVTMEADSPMAIESGMVGVYVVLYDETHGTMWFDGDSEDFTINGNTADIDGERCDFSLDNGVITITLPLEEMDMQMVFTKSSEDPPSESGGAPVDASGTCGDNAQWELRDRTLYITGSGPTYDYYYYDGEHFVFKKDIPWFDKVEDVDYVVIENGITRIGEGLLYTCEMVDVQIPDSVKTIGACAFMDCPYLYDVTIPASVTGIGDSVFWSCENLEEVTILSPSISIWADAFTFCSSLESITFAGSIERIEEDAFYGVTGTVYYPGGDFSWYPFVGHDYGGDLTWIPLGGEVPVIGERIDGNHFSIAMPDQWFGLYDYSGSGDFLHIFHKTSMDSGDGGHLVTFGLFRNQSDYIDLPSYELLGTLTNGETGARYDLVAIFPTDVQFSRQNQEEYLTMFNNLENLYPYISGEDGYTFTPI